MIDEPFSIQGVITGRFQTEKSNMTEVPRTSPTGRLSPSEPAIQNQPTLRELRNAWATCPVCKESATGKYAGAHACSRCGWNSRGTKQHKLHF